MPTWDSMEGETPIDPSHLKDKSIKTREQLNIAEARNILKAILKYLGAKPSRKLAPFDLNWFRQLHEEMFCDVWEYAGNFRQEDLNIGIKWQNILPEVYQLEGDLKFWEANQTYDVLERSVHIHYRAVHIHPSRFVLGIDGQLKHASPGRRGFFSWFCGSTRTVGHT